MKVIAGGDVVSSPFFTVWPDLAKPTLEPLSFGGAWELATCKAPEPDFDLIAPKLVVPSLEFLEPESENREGAGKKDEAAKVATMMNYYCQNFQNYQKNQKKTRRARI